MVVVESHETVFPENSTMLMTGRTTTRDLLAELLSERILFLDGGMGTMVHGYKPTEEDYRGQRFRNHNKLVKNCTDILVLTQPKMVEEIHWAYLEAGADIIETNSFGGTRIALADFDLEPFAYEINKEAANIARRAADRMTQLTPDRPRFVAGSIGPTNKSLTMARDLGQEVTFDEMVAAFEEQVAGLVDGGADLLLAETQIDTLTLKACLIAIRRYFDAKGVELPVMISGAFDKFGRTMVSSQSIEAFSIAVSHFDALSVGINCSLGPNEMRPYVETLSGMTRTHVSCYPNAGLPNALGEFDLTPEKMAPLVADFAAHGWVNILGGCCGTTPAHIVAMRQAVEDLPPRKIPDLPDWSHYSGTMPLEIRPETNFIMVGERTNVTGSRRFARLIREGKFEEALAVAREQVEGGANILDINMDEGLIDGEKAMSTFVKLCGTDETVSKVPLMIDSSKWSVIEAGLQCAQGKPIVNSISLKEGEEAFLEQARKVREYGAAVVVMAFDEQGQAVERNHKFSICERAYRLLTEEVGFPPSDIIFDPNILTVGTGMEEHNNYAVEFFEAVRMIKERLPGCKTSGGVSNVSFSFRGNETVREAMNAAFLYHAIRAGLDMGIVNAGQLEVYEEIPLELRERIEDVLLNRRPDATERLIEFSETVQKKGRAQAKDDAWREASVE